MLPTVEAFATSPGLPGSRLEAGAFRFPRTKTGRSLCLVPNRPPRLSGRSHSWPWIWSPEKFALPLNLAR